MSSSPSSPRRPITVVTGGSRGIGAATVDHLARQGHDVAVGYRSGREEAAAVVGAAQAHGGRAVAVRATSPTPTTSTGSSPQPPNDWGR